MHYLITNASQQYLEYLQRVLGPAGKILQVLESKNGLTLLAPAQENASASWLDWDGITHLSSFDFTSVIADAQPALAGLAPLSHQQAFIATAGAVHTEGVTGGANAYQNHFADSAAYTPRPPEENEKTLILNTAEGYDKIFSRKYDPAAAKRGDTSYATRYDVAPYLTMKRIKQTIETILALRPDKTAPFTVYDFGCGHGRFLIPLVKYLRHKGLTPRFLAYDPAPFALRTLKENLDENKISYADGGEVIITSDVTNTKGFKADLILSIAGSLQYVEPQDYAATLNSIRETLSPHGLLVGTGPSILTRYREASISRLDMRLASQMFAEAHAAIPALLDAQHEAILPKAFVATLKQNKGEAFTVADVAARYGFSIEELAIQLAELRFQLRALGHAAYMENGPYMSITYRAEQPAPDVYPEWSGKKTLYTRWMYELHSPLSLQEWLAQEGFLLHALLADCVNHNDVAAKDPATIQQELRIAASAETPLHYGMDYFYVASRA